MVKPTCKIHQNPNTKYDGLQKMNFHDPTVSATQSAAFWLKVSCFSKKFDGIADWRVIMFIRFRKL